MMLMPGNRTPVIFPTVLIACCMAVCSALVQRKPHGHTVRQHAVDGTAIEIYQQLLWQVFSPQLHPVEEVLLVSTDDKGCVSVPG